MPSSPSSSPGRAGTADAVRPRSRRGHAVRRAITGLVALGLAGCLAGCVTPARNDAQYRAKALAAVEAASSEVATARLTVTQRLDRRVTGPYADEVVTANETALGSVQNAFGAVQPPGPASDGTHDAVTDVLSAAADAVTHARIAVRRGDDAGLREAAGELGSAARELADAAGTLR